MNLLQLILLAIVQGVTEFLPVSSSGHLIVANELLPEKLPDIVGVEIALHLGTLASILVFYWRRIWRLLFEDRRVIWLMIVGTLPAVVVGLPLHKFGQGILQNTLLAGLMFPVTAGLLWWSSRREPGVTSYTELTWQRALVIGLFQAVAILPGISRSGATIAAGLIVGLRRESAAVFAFLLAIPAILGAGILESRHLMDDDSTGTPFNIVLIGAVVAFFVGLGALAVLNRLVQRGRLQYFAYWLIPLGIAVTTWQLWLLFRG
jgi:undecaprenyl-diphosphatase